MKMSDSLREFSWPMKRNFLEKKNRCFNGQEGHCQRTKRQGPLLDTWVPGKAGQDLSNRMTAGKEGEGNREETGDWTLASKPPLTWHMSITVIVSPQLIGHISSHGA